MRRTMLILFAIAAGCVPSEPSTHSEPLTVYDTPPPTPSQTDGGPDLSCSLFGAPCKTTADCCMPENPDPCGMQIVARGWIAERTDGSLDTYGMNVLGAAHASGGPGITKIRVAFKRPMTMGPHYQVLITGYSPTGKAFMVPRFGKHDAFFEVVVPDDWESFDFVVIGL